MQIFDPGTCDVTTVASAAQVSVAIAFGIELIMLAAVWYGPGRLRQIRGMMFVSFCRS
jgi:hypothetical protein